MDGTPRSTRHGRARRVDGDTASRRTLRIHRRGNIDRQRRREAGPAVARSHGVEEALRAKITTARSSGALITTSGKRSSSTPLVTTVNRHEQPPSFDVASMMSPLRRCGPPHHRRVRCAVDLVDVDARRQARLPGGDSGRSFHQPRCGTWPRQATHGPAQPGRENRDKKASAVERRVKQHEVHPGRPYLSPKRTRQRRNSRPVRESTHAALCYHRSASDRHGLQDYYKTLAWIRRPRPPRLRRLRKLARKHHPTSIRRQEAEARFKEITRPTRS